LKALVQTLVRSARDLLPIVAVIGFFQLVVLQQPLPDAADLVIGGLFVVVGLTLFIYGLEMGLFPIGGSMAHAFARKGNVWWLVVFAFALGFGTTIAEPALFAVAAEAGRMAAASGVVENSAAGAAGYAFGLRITVAIAVGVAVVVGVLRILRGWPLHFLIIGGYVLVMILTAFAPDEIVGIAYDSGGITTSTITVPLVTALGVGLAASISGRNPMLDGFGIIALASLTPMFFVLGYGMLY
jgi:MFS family permease